MDDQHRLIVKNELGQWHDHYLPIGKTVLDLGAGCGETAQFYLNHGAEKVLCVEGDPDAVKHLKANFGNDPRVIIFPTYVDSVKVDIEGHEENMVVETHFDHPYLKLIHQSHPKFALYKLSRNRPLISHSFFWLIHDYLYHRLHRNKATLEGSKQTRTAHPRSRLTIRQP